jgi:hypothetical protein
MDKKRILKWVGAALVEGGLLSAGVPWWGLVAVGILLLLWAEVDRPWFQARFGGWDPAKWRLGGADPSEGSTRYIKDGTVSVEPTEPIVLKNDRWTNVARLVIRNGNDRSVYSIWLKVFTDSAGVVAREIVPDGIPDAEAPIVVAGSVRISADLTGHVGVDSSGREAVLIRLYRIGPNDQRTLELTTTSRADRCVASVRVLGFRLSPDMMTVSGGEQGFLFSVPEKFQSRSLLMRRV